MPRNCGDAIWNSSNHQQPAALTNSDTPQFTHMIPWHEMSVANSPTRRWLDSQIAQIVDSSIFTQDAQMQQQCADTQYALRKFTSQLVASDELGCLRIK